MAGYSRFRDARALAAWRGDIPRGKTNDGSLTGRSSGLRLVYLITGAMAIDDPTPGGIPMRALPLRRSRRSTPVPARRWLMCWGPAVDRLRSAPGADVVSLAVSVDRVLSWPDVQPLLRRLIPGAFLLLEKDPADLALATRWSREADDADRQPLALLEIQALVRRAGARLDARPGVGPVSISSSGSKARSTAPGRPLRAMLAAIHERVGEPASLASIARAARLKPDTASRLFHRQVGCSLRDYRQCLRVNAARGLLIGGTMPIREIAEHCGFRSLSRFYAAFTGAFALTPAACRRSSVAVEAPPWGTHGQPRLRGHGFQPLEISRQRDPILVGHVHPHLELNFVFRGAMRYSFAGRSVVVPARRWTLLWAALPHALAGCDAGTDSLAIAVPVATASEWPGVDHLLERLMSARALVIDADPTDAALAERWTREGGDPRLMAIILIEIEAYVRRAALAHPGGPGRARRGRAMLAMDPGAASVAFGDMIAFLHQQVRSPHTVAEVAAASGVSPAVAARLFQRYLGCSIRSYQQRLRVAAARRLLAETRAPIVGIALSCGFQSLSRFYHVFKRTYGETPAALRRASP